MNILHPSRVGAAVRRQLTAIGFAANARANQRLCDDSLGARRTLTLVLLGSAIFARRDCLRGRWFAPP